MVSRYEWRQAFAPAAAAVVLTATLAGCAVLPPHAAQPRTLAGPDSFASAKSLPASLAAWPSDHWWESFGDPQLDALIKEGLVGATSIRVAEARFDEASALAGQARSRLLPSVGVSAEGGVTKQSYNYIVPKAVVPQGWPDYGQGVASLSWDLDFWGKNRAALAAARSEAEAAAAEAAATRLAVSAGIAAAYADLADLYAERDAAEDAVRVRGRTFDLMQGRERQGLENRAAANRAQSAFATARGEVVALNEAITLTQHRIAVLLGAGPDRGLKIKRPKITVQGTSGLPANLPLELIGRRPDIIAARLHAEAAASQIKVARAAFYPNINLTGLVGLQALNIGNVFKSGSDFGSVGPALSLPIFDAGRLKAQYRASEAGYKAAVAQYDGTLTEALREVADAATSKRALGERLDRATEAARAAEAAWTVANNRYEGGLGTYLDVLAAEDALIATRRTVATLKTRAFALDVALVRALGGGFRS